MEAYILLQMQLPPGPRAPFTGTLGGYLPVSRVYQVNLLADRARHPLVGVTVSGKLIGDEAIK
jgi:hypothetical protein